MYYNVLINALFEGCDVELGADYMRIKKNTAPGRKGALCRELWIPHDFCYGKLEYRSLHFESEVLNEENHQGVAVVNYTDRETPYTRVIEHKHFEYGTQDKTVITKEYPADWKEGMEPYYPINDEKNQELYQKYRAKADKESNLILGGRLAEYKYYDMDKVIESAFQLVEKELA